MIAGTTSEISLVIKRKMNTIINEENYDTLHFNSAMAGFTGRFYRYKLFIFDVIRYKASVSTLIIEIYRRSAYAITQFLPPRHRRSYLPNINYQIIMKSLWQRPFA